MLDETKRAVYRDMAISARGGEDKTRAGFHEMCAAGWMDGPTDLRMQYLSHPYFLLSINLANGELYEVHFDIMGEHVPVVSLPIHPFDTPSIRWLSARRGTRAPVPTSVVSAAFDKTGKADIYRGQEPPYELLEAAVAEFFPNWKALGRSHFEP